MNGLDQLARELPRAIDRPLADDIDIARVGPYRGYRELVARWHQLACDGAVRPRRIGHSALGEPLFALDVGPDVAPATSVILAGLHPIEWIGVETALALLERLADDPPRDRVITIFPLINVDGFRQVEADLRAGRRRWRRSNARGVDLNRNWPTHFKPRSARLARMLLGYNYGGPGPLSEPEIAAVVAVLDEIDQRGRIDVALSMHSVGRMLLTPYGGIWRAPRASPTLMRAVRSVQQRMAHPYRHRQSARWVPGAFAHGMELDHLHARYGATAVLVECSAGGLRWTDRSSWLSPFRWFNPPEPGKTTTELTHALEPLVRGHF